MIYKLYETIAIPLTDTQKKKGIKDPVSYFVKHFHTLNTKYEANEWVNLDSGSRSWTECEEPIQEK